MVGIMASQHFKKQIIGRVGDIEYDQEDLFFFEKGLYGFENLRDFILTELPSPETPKFYRYLQSVEVNNLCLVVMNILFDKKGNGIIHRDDLEPYFEEKALKFNDVLVFLVTSIHMEKGVQRLSVNAKAPIILAPGLQKGWQVILDRGNYEVKHYLV